MSDLFTCPRCQSADIHVHRDMGEVDSRVLASYHCHSCHHLFWVNGSIIQNAAPKADVPPVEKAPRVKVRRRRERLPEGAVNYVQSIAPTPEPTYVAWKWGRL